MSFKITSFLNTKSPVAVSLMVILISLNLLTVGCWENNLKNENSNRIVVPPPPSELYGGIEIGSTGVKTTILRAKYGIPKTENDTGSSVEVAMPPETTNTKIMEGLDKEKNFAATPLEDTVNTVTKYYNKLKDQNVIPEQIYIVGSSGLLDANEVSRNKLSDKIIEATHIKMLFLTPLQEVEYSIARVVPKQYRSSAFLMDVGGGNTKGGYMETDDTDPHCAGVQVPLGTVTAANEMDKAATTDAEKAALKELEKGNKTDIQNVIYAERVRANIFEPALNKELSRKAGFIYRKRLYLVGGINWALATLTHPGGWDSDGMVRLTVQDINDFTWLAKVNPERLLHPDLSGIKDEATRKQVEKDVKKISEDFNPKNMMAGGELLQAIVNVCKLKAKDKEIFFAARLGQAAWLYKFIETVIKSKLKG